MLYICHTSSGKNTFAVFDYDRASDKRDERPHGEFVKITFDPVVQLLLDVSRQIEIVFADVVASYCKPH